MADPAGTVLVVDDDRAVTDLYARQLRERYEVTTAYDGESALERLTADVDVVLLDRRMPGLSGSDVLEAIEERDIDCGVVMVTAVDPGFDIIEMGFDDYLLKPVTREQLHGAVEDTIERAAESELAQEYLALASKLATLRMEKDPAELSQSQEYQELERELERLRKKVDLSEIDADVPGDV